MVINFNLIRSILIFLSLFIFFVLVSGEVYAKGDAQDVIYLKDGSIVKGKIIEIIPDEGIKLRTRDGSIFIYKNDKIKEIIKGDVVNKDKKDDEAGSNDFTGNINLRLGSKSLDEDDWGPVEDQTEFGLEVDFRGQDWPVSIAMGISTSSDEGDYDGMDIEGETDEFYIGAKKIWESESSIVRPFIAGGICLIRGEFEGSYWGESVSDDDSSLGIWIGGGLYWTLGESFNIGLDLKYSDAEINLYDVDGNAGGIHFAALFGYHW